jgi:hypothetical protein
LRMIVNVSRSRVVIQFALTLFFPLRLRSLGGS